jgi:hypothetical protein
MRMNAKKPGHLDDEATGLPANELFSFGFSES